MSNLDIGYSLHFIFHVALPTFVVPFIRLNLIFIDLYLIASLRSKRVMLYCFPPVLLSSSGIEY